MDPYRFVVDMRRHFVIVRRCWRIGRWWWLVSENCLN